MDLYEEHARYDLEVWQEKIMKEPSFTSQITKGLQAKVNNLIPEKVHKVITSAIKNMVKGVLIGSEFISGDPFVQASLAEREKLVQEKIEAYKKIAAVEGAGTGAGGFLLSLADFPLLLTLKMKLLFDIAGLYGFNVQHYQERVFILYIFQLAFSSPGKRAETYQYVLDWKNHSKQLPSDMNSFDWRTFQQEYRDYIDLAKMLQLIPGIGAVIGAVANHQLVDKLGNTAIFAYRLRWFDKDTQLLIE